MDTQPKTAFQLHPPTITLCDSAHPAVSLALITICHCIIYWPYSWARVFFMKAETYFLR